MRTVLNTHECPEGDQHPMTGMTYCVRSATLRRKDTMYPAHTLLFGVQWIITDPG